MGRAMPFVRHELGKRLRAEADPRVPPRARRDARARGPASSSSSTSSRRAGSTRTSPPVGESLPTPSQRGCRTRATRTTRRPPAERRPPGDAGQAGVGLTARRTSAGDARLDEHAVIDLSPWLGPCRRGGRRRGSASARRVLARRSREPRRRHASARRSPSWRPRRSAAATATPVFADPVPPLYDFRAGHRDAPGRTRTRRRLRPRSSSRDCGALDRDRRGRATAIRSCSSALPRVVIDHHASNDATGAGRLDRAGSGRDLRDGRARWRPASACRSTRAAALAAELMAGHRDGHGDVRPPERDAPDARRRRRARRGRARPRPTSRAGSTARSPRPSCGCSAASLDRPRDGAAGGRIVHASLFDADLAATGAIPALGGIIDLLAQSDEAEVAIIFKEAGQGDPAERPDEARRRRRDGPDRARSAAAATRRAAGERTVAPAGRRARGRRSPEAERLVAATAPLGPTRMDGDPRRRTSRPARRRTTSSRLVRRLAATKRVGHGGTLDPFASGRAAAVPRAGDAARRVPPRRHEGLPGDDLLRGLVDDRRPRGRADARRRPGAGARRRSRRRCGGFLGEIAQRPPRLQRDQGRRAARAYAMARRREYGRARRASA